MSETKALRITITARGDIEDPTAQQAIDALLVRVVRAVEFETPAAVGIHMLVDHEPSEAT